MIDEMQIRRCGSCNQPLMRKDGERYRDFSARKYCGYRCSDAAASGPRRPDRAGWGFDPNAGQISGMFEDDPRAKRRDYAPPPSRPDSVHYSSIGSSAALAARSGEGNA